jgi:hypothetical protein
MDLRKVGIMASLIATCCLFIIGEVRGQKSKYPPIQPQKMETPCK